jgi:hypothetical protein
MILELTSNVFPVGYNALWATNGRRSAITLFRSSLIGHSVLSEYLRQAG